jgi:hypothetical protein
MVEPPTYYKSKTESFKSIPTKKNNRSPTKSIYDLVKQEVKLPEGLLFRGKYVGQSKKTKIDDI